MNWYTCISSFCKNRLLAKHLENIPTSFSLEISWVTICDKTISGGVDWITDRSQID